MQKKTVFFLTLMVIAGLAFGASRIFKFAGEKWEKGEREEHESRQQEHGGEDEFFRQRAYPLNTIPLNARQNAVEQAENEMLRLSKIPRFAKQMAQLEADSQAWTALGPKPINAVPGDTAISYSGRVSAIALHPQYNGSSNKTVYVGGAQGGVWRSTDNGQTWTPLLDGQPSQSIGSIAIDPLNPNNIFVGTGEANRSGDSYYGAGLLKSTDGGATWRVIGGPTSPTAPFKPVFVNAAIAQISIDPITPNVMFIATTFGSTAASSGGVDFAVESGKQKGIWRSTDSGETWVNVDPDGSIGAQSAHDVLVDPINHNTVYAAVRARGIYRSTAGGAAGTWQKLTNGIATSTAASVTFLRCAIAAGPAISPSTSSTLYASFANANDESIFGFYKSTDGGDSWTRVTTPPTETTGSGQADYNMAIAVDPTDSNVVYYGGQYNYSLNRNCVVRSTDAGVTWTDMNSNGLHPDTHAVVVAKNNRNVLFTGNDGGIWRTDAAPSGATTWTTLNNGLSLTQFQSVAFAATDPNLIIGGTQDNGTNGHKGTLDWTNLDDGDGGFSLVDQSNPQVMYHTYYNVTGTLSPVLSTNGGNTWTSIGCNSCTPAQGKLNRNDRVRFYAPMALNPAFKDATNGNVIYFGTHRLYRSANRGTTWTGVGASTDGFGTDVTTGSGSVTTIAAYPKVDTTTTPATEIVWVGTSDGQVQVTSNAGELATATFTNVTKSPLPNRYVTDIAVDSNNPNRAAVVYSGFEANTPTTLGHVFLTTDRGTTWTNISGNLPDVPTTSIAFDPNNASRIWIGTDIGVFQTTDGGATWLALNNGMPKIAVFMLRFQAATGNLIAATHGRGIYRMRTYAAAATVSAATYTGTSVAPESIAAVFGVNLSTSAGGAAPAGVLPLPTTLFGTTVTVTDSQGTARQAALFYVGAGQVNYQIPAGTAAGTATVTVTNSLGESSTGTITVAATTPGLFTGNADGSGAAVGAAIRVQGTNQLPRENLVLLDSVTNRFVTSPINFSPTTESLFFELYGTGIRSRTSQANVQCTIGGVTIPVEYAGVAPGYVGLDQVNIQIPASLDNRGEVDLILTVDGKQSQAVKVNIK